MTWSSGLRRLAPSSQRCSRRRPRGCFLPPGARRPSVPPRQVLARGPTRSRVLIVGEVTDALRASVRAIARSRDARLEESPGPQQMRPSRRHLAHRRGPRGCAHGCASGYGAGRGPCPRGRCAGRAGCRLVGGRGRGRRAGHRGGHRARGWAPLVAGPRGVTAAWTSDRIDVERAVTLLDPLPRASLLGLARSVGWLLMYVGLPWAFERAARLTARLVDALAAIDGVELSGPTQGLATTVALRIAGWPAEEAAAELGRRCFAVLDVDARRGLLRAGVGAWLRESDLDRFVAAVDEARPPLSGDAAAPADAHAAR